MKTPFFKRSFSDQIFPIKGKNIIVPKKQLDFKIIKIISKNNQILNKNNETKSLDSFFNFFKYKKNDNKNFMTKCETDKIISINNFLFEEKLNKLKNKGKKIDVLRFSENSSKNDIKEIFADQINENFKTEKNDKIFDVIVFDNYEENKTSDSEKKEDTKLVKFYKKSVEFSNFEEK